MVNKLIGDACTAYGVGAAGTLEGISSDEKQALATATLAQNFAYETATGTFSGTLDEYTERENGLFAADTGFTATDTFDIGAVATPPALCEGSNDQNYADIVSAAEQFNMVSGFAEWLGQAQTTLTESDQ